MAVKTEFFWLLIKSGYVGGFKESQVVLLLVGRPGVQTSENRVAFSLAMQFLFLQRICGWRTPAYGLSNHHIVEPSHCSTA